MRFTDDRRNRPDAARTPARRRPDAGRTPTPRQAGVSNAKEGKEKTLC